MQDTLSRFQQYIRKNPVLVAVFTVAEIAIIILIIFSFRNVATDNNQVPSTGIVDIYQTISDLPKDSADVIEQSLYSAIKLNGGTLTSLSESDAQIRADSLVNIYFDKVNMHYVNFIVDIPSIEQSYQVFREWSDDPSNPNYLVNRSTMVMCPLEEQKIYPDFNCHDDYDYNGQSIVVSEFIYYLVDLEHFRVYIQTATAPYTIIIGPTDFNADEVTKSIYIDQTKEYVASLGFPSDAFTYYVADGPQDLDLYLEQIISENN